MDFSEHCTITATLRCFSSCVGKDSGSTEYHCDGVRFNDYFRVTFNANGSCVENEGHVSVVFNVIDWNFFGFAKPVAFSCTASVIDSSGNKRFPQSLALDMDCLYKEDRLFFQKGFGFDKFVKRSTLLDDPSELLPDNCLTLCLDIDFEVICNFILNVFKYDTDGIVRKDGRWYLRMDTEFGRDLCKMSTVFQNMMECTTVESGSDLIPIAPAEYKSFQFIHNFLSEFTLDGTLSRIYNLYVLADKYDMQPVVQLCHRLLISVLRAMNTGEKLEYVDKDMHMISELAERFEKDESLREILAIYSDIKNKIEGCSGELDASDVWKLKTEWNCEFRRGKDSFVVFVFRKKQELTRLSTDSHK